MKQYLEFCNEDPKQLIWTKSADDILKQFKTYYKRASDTGY